MHADEQEGDEAGRSLKRGEQQNSCTCSFNPPPPGHTNTHTQVHADEQEDEEAGNKPKRGRAAKSTGPARRKKSPEEEAFIDPVRCVHDPITCVGPEGSMH